MFGALEGLLIAPRAASAQTMIGSSTPTSATMRNVDFHIGPGVALHIRRLRGEMHSLKNGVVDFDDSSSYALDVATAEVGMLSDDLTNLMTRYVFNYDGAPLSHLRVDVTPEGIRQRGTLHKGVDIPFDMTASVSLTTDGRIQLPSRARIDLRRERTDAHARARDQSRETDGSLKGERHLRQGK